MRHIDIKLTDQYIAGFVDGEGCFSLTMRRDIRHERKSKATYYSWKASFVIVLRLDDTEVLNLIQKYFGCGSVTHTKTSVRFQISNITELDEHIIPFFQKNPLVGKKGKDFILWSEAIRMLIKYKKKRGKVNVKKGSRGFQRVEWKKEDTAKIIDIHSRISVYKSQRPPRKWTNKKLGRE